jgi:hypothetical protein
MNLDFIGDGLAEAVVPSIASNPFYSEGGINRLATAIIKKRDSDVRRMLLLSARPFLELQFDLERFLD